MPEGSCVVPDLDLPPGDYRERKPKGWRWKLPWSHDDDTYELVGCKRQPYVSLVHFR